LTPPDVLPPNGDAERPAITWRRAWNIACRTLHIGVSGVLVGGHIFDVDRDRLVLWLNLTIVSGVGLIALEANRRWRWFHEGRGVLTILKLLLICLIPSLWAYRGWLLAAVIVLASVGSHMPARYRYRSVWTGQLR
jgi:uncharacterized membrane protein